MKSWRLLIILAMSASVHLVYAADAIDRAVQKLDADIAKLHRDMGQGASKETLASDKKTIKQDQAALKAARDAGNLKKKYASTSAAGENGK